MSTVGLINADSFMVPLADRSVQMAACSPPYWRLRDYGLGDAGMGNEDQADCLGWATGQACGKCFICHLRRVGSEVWRVLRNDGVWFMNLGDTYYGGAADKHGMFKKKDLCLIPARAALALQADGWCIRSDIIWSKPSPMPDGARDRPTKAHEYIYLLTKRPHYFWDKEAIREKPAGYSRAGGSATYTANGSATHGKSSKTFHQMNPNGRNRLSVWTVFSEGYAGAHFATWPKRLAERMIKAGTSEAGCCPVCRSPYERIIERQFEAQGTGVRGDQGEKAQENTWDGFPRGTTRVTTLGWRPGCDCCQVCADRKQLHVTFDGHEIHDPYPPVPCTVLDVFAGSGTTGVVGRKLGRDVVLLDLSFDYLKHQARRRLELDKLEDFGKRGISDNGDYNSLPLFQEVEETT